MAPGDAGEAGRGPPQGCRDPLANALRGVAIPLHPGAARFYREQGLAGVEPPRSPPGRAPAVVVDGLAKSYGDVAAVADLSFTVGRAARPWRCSGPNGAGKTTTIAMLLGLLEPSAGTIRILGQADAARRRRGRCRG